MFIHKRRQPIDRSEPFLGATCFRSDDPVETSLDSRNQMVLGAFSVSTYAKGVTPVDERGKSKGRVLRSLV